MATSQASTSAVTKVQTYSVRLPRDVNSQKKYSLLKFNKSNNVDFTVCGTAKIERENNFKEFKSANDIELLPKFGAGSEFGREEREEARKKKFGVRIRKYNIDDQPYLLKLGAGKQLRRFKGTREGGVAENTSFFIFMQCADGQTFEAHPIDDWYMFTPQAKYKYLNSEEAEEEFNRRDKTLNYFSIMVKNRLKNDDGVASADVEEGETGKKKSSKKDRSLTLTEFDDWDDMSDDNRDDSDNEHNDGDDKPKKATKVKANKNKANSDDEALEESDDVDEGQEDLVDYMSGSSSDDESMYDEKDREVSEKYAEKGVEDEEGLRKLVDSGDEDEDEDDKKDEDNEDDDAKDDKKDSDSEGSSGSDSDSDPEKGNNFASALFMSQEKKPVKKQEVSGEPSSRPSTPAPSTSDTTSRGKKRKGDSPATAAKKAKSEAATTPAATNTANTLPGSENSMLEKLRSYLMRKPMTTLDLLQKIKLKFPNLTKEQLTSSMGDMLKRLDPQKIMINNRLHLQLK